MFTEELFEIAKNEKKKKNRRLSKFKSCAIWVNTLWYN